VRPPIPPLHRGRDQAAADIAHIFPGRLKLRGRGWSPPFFQDCPPRESLKLAKEGDILRHPRRSLLVLTPRKSIPNEYKNCFICGVPSFFLSAPSPAIRLKISPARKTCFARFPVPPSPCVFLFVYQAVTRFRQLRLSTWRRMLFLPFYMHSPLPGRKKHPCFLTEFARF